MSSDVKPVLSTGPISITDLAILPGYSNFVVHFLTAIIDRIGVNRYQADCVSVLCNVEFDNLTIRKAKNIDNSDRSHWVS